MRAPAWLQILAHRTRMWLARRWCDPNLAMMAERYGAVLVTAERHGKMTLPLYHAVSGGDAMAGLVRRVYELEAERDFWKRRARL